MSCSLCGQNSHTLVTSKDAITDMVIASDFVYFATDAGELYSYSLLNNKSKKQYTFPHLVDFFGDSTETVIHSIDVFEETNTLFAVSQGDGGYRNVSKISKSGIASTVISDAKHYMITRIFALSPNSCAFVTMSNEVIKVNENGNVEWKISLNQSVNTYASWLSKYESILVSDESGLVTLVDVKNGKVMGEFDIHKDYVYSISGNGADFVTGSKDKQIKICNVKNHVTKEINNGFPVYAVAISQDGNKVVYLKNDENYITVYNKNEEEKYSFQSQHESIINEILFIDNTTILTCGLDGKIVKWRNL